MHMANTATAASRVVLFFLMAGATLSCAKAEPGADASRGTRSATAPRAAQPPPKLDPNNAVWSLVLDDALPRETGTKPLEVYVQRRGGRWRQALGLAPRWNVSPHKVDAAGLTFDGVKLTGTVAVTLVPDAWVPPERREVAATFTVNAVVDEGRVDGTYEGEVGGTRTAGPLGGTVEPDQAADVRNCRVELRLEGALPPAGLEDWMRRVWAAVAMVDGRPRECTVTFSPLSPEDRTGACDPSDLRLTRDLLGGTLTAEARVDPNKVAYSYRLAGIVVGRRIGGTFTYRLGEQDQSGTFTGTILRLSEPSPD